MNIAEELELMDIKFNTLKRTYDQYFLGNVKFEPVKEREEIQRKIAVITNTVINNTGLKFKFQTFTSKFNSYAALWSRQVRLKEEGKPIVPVRIEENEEETRHTEHQEHYGHLWNDNKIHNLCTKVNEIASNLNGKLYSKESIKNFVEKSVTEIRQKYNKEVVDFNVVVKDGKVKFLPVLK